MDSVDFSEEDRRRYARHLHGLDGFTEDMQRRLKGARALIVGAGGLGSAVAYYLACAGVGALRIADPDRVEISNLQRQILHTEADLGKRKTDSAAARLRALNSALEIETFDEGLTARNAARLCEGCDIVLDCSDNFPTRYLANDAAFFARKPLVHTGVGEYAFQCAVFDPARGSCCLRCHLPTPPQAGVRGVLAPVVGVAGAFQALCAVKYLCGLEGARAGVLYYFDARSMRGGQMELQCDEGCPLCGKTPTITALCQ